MDFVVIDGSLIDESKNPGTNSKNAENSGKKTLKRKRALFNESVSGVEKELAIAGYCREIDGLFAYFRDVLAQKVDLDDGGSPPINLVIACLLEESSLPYSKLVEEIYEKLKSNYGVTLALVRSSMLLAGQRMMYGIGNANADVLEDESESCLWCWETRDMKLLPKIHRGILNIRRICRRKIHERINVLSAMISMLSKSECHVNYKADLKKASEKLGKALNEAQIRSLIDSLMQKNSSEMVDKEAKLKEKELIKELERSQREIAKQQRRIDRELQKEKLQNEREQKRLQDEAEKEDRRREREGAELKKQLKRQQEEADKDQRRREKEEAELKKQLALQKQASMMERFLKIKKNSLDVQDVNLSGKAPELSNSLKSKDIVNPVTLSMDGALSQEDDVGVPDLLRSHLVSWHKLGQSIRGGKSHWGIRWKPKVALFTELKLQESSSEVEPSGIAMPSRRHVHAEVKNGNDSSLLKPIEVDGWEETVANGRSCDNCIDVSLSDIRLCNKTKKLLQFDKSHRPAYYGTFSTKSGVVRPRKPFQKDPSLDYDIESDEEWEEEDPGESLSDCDKDEEEEILDEGRAEDEDESEDSFMVPDGYLSENEGVQVDKTVSDATADEVRSSPSCMQEVECEDLIVLLRQQKCLNDLTEQALRRNQPLIISNLLHENAAFIMADYLTSTSKLEQICLQALSMRSCFGCQTIEISTDPNPPTKDKELGQSQHKTSISPSVLSANVLDLDLLELREVVLSIQSCSHGMNKVVESLQKKFPFASKTQLRNRVREVSNFVDNRWQVKKDVLEKLGLSKSPEKGIVRTKGIATFFSKRCLPPAHETINVGESSLQSCHKPVIYLDGSNCVENHL